MSMFVALTPLNAANFESDAATDGQVLTADGAGGAAWEDAAGGGGGGGFGYNEIAFSPGEFTASSGSRTVDISALLNGVSATGVVIFNVTIYTDANFDGSSVNCLANELDGITTLLFNNLADSVGSPIWMHAFVVASGGECKTTITIVSEDIAAHDRYIVCWMPDGRIVTSDAISIPGTG